MGLAHGEQRKRERQEGVWVDVWRMRTERNGQRERAGGRVQGGRGGTTLELNHPSNCMEEF